MAGFLAAKRRLWGCTRSSDRLYDNVVFGPKTESVCIRPPEKYTKPGSGGGIQINQVTRDGSPIGGIGRRDGSPIGGRAPTGYGLAR